MTTQPEQQTTAPEAVAWFYKRPGTKGTILRDRMDSCPDGATESALVTLPDALAYADAQVGEVVAWLRGGAGLGGPGTRDARDFAAALGERIADGEHRT